MARRGRPRKNPALGVVAAPQAAQGPPEMPATIAMDGVAAREWSRVAELLGASLGPADVGVLTSYCAAFALVVHTRRALAPAPPPMVDEAGKPLRGAKLRKAKEAAAELPWVLTTIGGSGGVKLHPLVSQLNGALRDLARYADALGLTPTARARVGASLAPAEDAFDEYLRARSRKV